MCVFSSLPVSNRGAADWELDVGPSNYKSSAILPPDEAALSLRACGPGPGEAEGVWKGLLLPSCHGGFPSDTLISISETRRKVRLPPQPADRANALRGC